MLPGFGDVDGNPSHLVDVELGPAVVTGDFGGVLVGREGEADLEARRNVLRTRHRHEDGVEVGAVAALGVAGPKCVAVSPPGAGLVVSHGGKDVVVDRARLVELC